MHVVRGVHDHVVLASVMGCGYSRRRGIAGQLEANNCPAVLCGAACAAAGRNLATASSSTAPAAACSGSGRLGGGSFQLPGILH